MCSVKAGITAVVNKILKMIQKVRKHTDNSKHYFIQFPCIRNPGALTSGGSDTVTPGGGLSSWLVWRIRF